METTKGVEMKNIVACGCMILFILSFAVGELYAGCIEGDCENGYGVMTYPMASGTTAKYTGQFQNGNRHGKGKLAWYFTGGHTLKDGEWENGKMDGYGLFEALLFGTKTSYDGEWKNGKYNGKGTFIDTKGSKYVGGFKNGKRHGFGVQTYPDGTKKEGQWAYDIFEGN